MKCVVTCPGCDRRLRLAVTPGKRLNCPACGTAFVLGAQTNVGGRGLPQFLAFEIFDQLDATEVVRRVPPPKRPAFRPGARLSAVRPVRVARIVDGFEVIDDSDSVFVDDAERMTVDINLDFEIIAPKGLLPDEFGLIDDDAPPKRVESPPPPVEQKMLLPLPPTARPPENPVPIVKPERRFAPAPPKAPLPTAPKPVHAELDLRLPDDLEMTAPLPTPTTKLSASKSMPKSIVPKQQIHSDGFDIVPPPRPVVESGIVVVSRPPSKAEFEVAAQPVTVDFQAAQPLAPPEVAGVRIEAPLEVVPVPQSAPARIEVADLPGDAQSDRYDEEDELWRRHVERREVHQSLPSIFWGVSVVQAAVVMTAVALLLIVLAALLQIFGMILAGPSNAFLALSGICVLVAVLLLLLQEVAALIGFAISLGAPTRAAARGWAIVTMALAVADLGLYGLSGLGGFAFADDSFLRFVLVPATCACAFAKWICYLFFLRAIAQALHKSALEAEVANTLKLWVAAAVVNSLLYVFAVGFAPLAASIGVHTGDIGSSINAVIIVSMVCGAAMIGLTGLALVRYAMCCSAIRHVVRANL